MELILSQQLLCISAVILRTAIPRRSVFMGSASAKGIQQGMAATVGVSIVGFCRGKFHQFPSTIKCTERVVIGRKVAKNSSILPSLSRFRSLDSSNGIPPFPACMA